jgi:hypothetical protein
MGRQWCTSLEEPLRRSRRRWVDKLVATSDLPTRVETSRSYRGGGWCCRLGVLSTTILATEVGRIAAVQVYRCVLPGIKHRT